MNPSRYQYKSVWDPVTRAWHWLLALSVICGWLLGEFRTFSIIQWHIYAGYCTGVLLLFRLIWGIKGPTIIRFSTLIPRYQELLCDLRGYFRRQPSGFPGHSPLGAIASLVMLCLLVVQVASGMFSEDDSLFHEGPLAYTISSAMVGKVTEIHYLCSRLLLIMFGLHIAVMVFYYFWKKENLVIAMITGNKLMQLKRAEGHD